MIDWITACNALIGWLNLGIDVARDRLAYRKNIAYFHANFEKNQAQKKTDICL